MKKSLLSLPALALLAACGDGPSGPRTSRDDCAGQGGAYAGDVSLGVGQTLALAPGASLCLALPGGGAEYALAYVDTRAIQGSATARETPLDSFVVRVTGAGGARAARIPGREGPRPGPLFGEAGDLLPTVELSADPALTQPSARSAPWTDGEVFTLLDNVQLAERRARVRRIYDGWLVVATFEDEAIPAIDGTLAMLDAGWPSLRQHGVPLLDAVFGGVKPVTSTASGQLLMLVRRDLVNAAGVAYGATDGTNVYSWLAILPNGQPTSRTPVSLGSLVFHEITHAYQRAWLHATRPEGARVTPAAGGTIWSIEGGAALMQRELVRRQAGQSLTSNFDWRAPAATDAARWYSIFAQPNDGSFSDGYTESEDFMADLVGRVAARGRTPDQAVTEVMRGSLEGWYGWALAQQPRRAGLVERMRPILGSGWEPSDALLTWTLSRAADDRTPSEVLQTPTFRDVWDVRSGEYGWTAHASLAPGSGDVAAKRAYSSAGYFYLSGAGPLSLTSSVDGVRWMLARIR